MNWNRIAVFTIGMFLATAAAGFPFGFVQGFVSSRGQEVPSWLGPGSTLTSAVVTSCVFYLLARKEPASPYIHAWALFACCAILGFLANVVALGIPPLQWLMSLFFAVISLLVGVFVARRRPAA